METPKIPLPITPEVIAMPPIMSATSPLGTIPRPILNDSFFLNPNNSAGRPDPTILLKMASTVKTIANNTRENMDLSPVPANELKSNCIPTITKNAGTKILRFMGVQAPVFGMAGTLIGLIQMLMHIDNPSTIGPALATALITTFYGLILANLIVTPITAKLTIRTESEVTLIKTIRIGVMGIFERSNPAKIQKSMNALLAPDERRN